MNDLSQYIREVPDFPQKGIIFRDITPLLMEPQAIRKTKEVLVEQIAPMNPTAVMAIESRGFLFGMLIADALQIKFIPVRKKGKLPYKTIQHSYALEYGTAEVEVHEDALMQGDRVVIHDDLLATGGTASAAAALAGKLKASIAGFSFIIELVSLQGREVLKQYNPNVNSIIKY